MTYVVDINKLYKGDIILRRWPEDKLSQLIMNETHSNYSHALLCVDYSTAIDAGGTVRAVNPLRDCFSNAEDAAVLRLKSQFRKDNIIDKAVEYVRRTIGTQYSKSEAREVLSSAKLAKEPNRQICTRLIAQAFENAGLPIVDNSDYPTIRDLENSPYFERVSSPNMTVTPQIQEIIDSECLIPKQEKIISQLLKDCRDLYPQEDIQTFEQLFGVSLRYPENNVQLAELISKSGYLDLWKEEEALNSYNFDSDLFLNKMGSNAYIAALQSIEANEQCYSRYSKELLILQSLNYSSNPVVDILCKLYENLVDQCLRRRKVFNDVLNRTSNLK